MVLIQGDVSGSKHHDMLLDGSEGWVLRKPMGEAADPDLLAMTPEVEQSEEAGYEVEKEYFR